MGGWDTAAEIRRLRKQVRKASDPEAKAAAQRELDEYQARIYSEGVARRTDAELNRIREASRPAETTARKAAAAEKKRLGAFEKSPQGRARAAKTAGARMFQISLPVSATEKAFWGDEPLYGSSMMTKTREHASWSDLELIEAEGWRLEHVGYVFQPTGAQSRDRFITSGHVETIVGSIIGNYLSRATE
jgi:hypothetical protein